MYGIIFDEFEKYAARQLGDGGLATIRIVRGAAAHYRVEVTISEERCMLRGDPECLITVSEGEV
ncbi:MAG TPA: hypothetical protein VGS16_09795 [Candidatus Dormibacteraeota bacterium]|nr:hypothetical protein [Candidatus Dormibacteraeota bacterium]